MPKRYDGGDVFLIALDALADWRLKEHRIVVTRDRFGKHCWVDLYTPSPILKDKWSLLDSAKISEKDFLSGEVNNGK